MAVLEGGLHLRPSLEGVGKRHEAIWSRSTGRGPVEKRGENRLVLRFPVPVSNVKSTARRPYHKRLMMDVRRRDACHHRRQGKKNGVTSTHLFETLKHGTTETLNGEVTRRRPAVAGLWRGRTATCHQSRVP